MYSLSTPATLLNYYSMITLFKSANESGTAEKNLEQQQFFEGVKNGRWQDDVIDYRAGRLEKKKLPCVTTSGVFNERKKEKLIEHSGLICLDIDAKDQICKFEIESIINDQYTYAVHHSVGGSGWAVYVKIDGTRHLDAFLGLEKYYFLNFSIILDKSCKDVTRLRFVSYDPDLFLNEKSKRFAIYLPKKEIEKKKYNPVVIKSDFDNMVSQASTLNLFDEYQDYISLAFALTSEFKESGRQYFHNLCLASSKYTEKQADNDYNIALRRDRTGITIRFVYWKFKAAGISLTSEKTEQIKSIAQVADNPKEKLKELNITDDENIIDQILKKDIQKTKLDLVIDFIKMSKIKFNEITRCFEINGENMNDRIFAEFCTKVWQRIDKDFSKDRIWTLIQNRLHSESYNPIIDWFEANKMLKYDDEFSKLVDCINSEHEKKYIEIYLKKWLLSIIASAFGTYSLMILVLIGRQGKKKTEFFRNLLPPSIRQYYAESNLDEGKDSEILMTKKLIIMDDEFGGKSKKDSQKLKRLSSQQTFSIRMPYGRISEDLTRLAVLCGTTNQEEVINDPTGNRRVLPINISEIDMVKYIKIDKDKLFIQLYHEYLADTDGWFLTDNEIEYLNESTEKNTEVMTEVEIFERYLIDDHISQLTATDIKLAFERIFPSFRTNAKKIGQAMKKLGFEQKIKRDGKKVKRIYEVKLEGVEIVKLQGEVNTESKGDAPF